MGSGQKARSVIELLSLTESELSSDPAAMRKFVRRLAVLFHPDTAGVSESNIECVQFLNAVLAEL